MKKVFIIFLLLFLFSVKAVASQSFDERFNQGVLNYKKGNPSACIYIMKDLEKQDPYNSYVLYYLAISNAKLGYAEKAKDAYEKVVMLNDNSKLVSYSKLGLKNLQVASVKNNSPRKSGGIDISIDEPVKTFSGSKHSAKDNQPSDKEIANAVKVLKRAGLLNLDVGNNKQGNGFMMQNPEMMQMNMLMGSMGQGGSKKSTMDMLPFLMMQQSKDGKKNISPEIMQIMMNNMMMEGMSSLTLDKDK